VSEQSELEVIRSAYADWAQGKFGRPDMFDPEVEFVMGGPEPRTYKGPQGARTGWYDFLSAWASFTVEAEEILPAGQGRYVVYVRLRGRGKESGLPVESAVANVVVMRNDRIARFEQHWNREEALRNAGLR
jgi:ketosteroid isomerase-like protein